MFRPFWGSEKSFSILFQSCLELNSRIKTCTYVKANFCQMSQKKFKIVKTESWYIALLEGVILVDLAMNLFDDPNNTQISNVIFAPCSIIKRCDEIFLHRTYKRTIC